MRYGSEPVPDAFGPRGIEYDLTAEGGNVELRCIGVAKRDEIERPHRIEPRRDAPLIAVDAAGQLHAGRSWILPCHRQRLFNGDAVDGAAVNGRDGLAPAIPVEQPIDRLIVQHVQPQFARIMRQPGGRHRAIRRDPHLVPCDIRERRETLPLDEVWKRHIHHDEAGHEPHREQQASGDADPLVSDIQPPPQSPDHRAAHDQNFTLSDNSAVRGIPSSHCVAGPPVA